MRNNMKIAITHFLSLLTKCIVIRLTYQPLFISTLTTFHTSLIIDLTAIYAIEACFFELRFMYIAVTKAPITVATKWKKIINLKPYEQEV